MCYRGRYGALGPRILVGVISTLTWCAFATTPTTAPSNKAFEPIPSKHLHNIHRVSDRVLSGAQPDGIEAFEELAALGVKTIISVDGAKPDVETARRFNMRYIHLPISYDTVRPEDGMAIAKAIKEMPGPIYIHCHHGRHRSAAATAVACVLSGELKPEQAESVLQTFGTGENYKGLWQAAREARPVEPEVLEKLKVEYVETAAVPPLAEAMVAVDMHWDHLKLMQKLGWQVPPDHPDLVPAHEALQLEERLHELSRTGAIADQPGEFRKLMVEAEQAVRILRQSLLADPFDRAAADANAKKVSASCLNCHAIYRD
jgi:protein tyrosine phosphatase (PTP) superfamily phosphohydrolase (DUF442 family)